MNKLLLPLAFAFALTTVLGSQEAFAMTVLFDEPLDGTPQGAFISTALTGDDFVLSTGASVTDVHFVVLETPGGFDEVVFYSIFTDNGGIPGTEIPGSAGTGISVVTGNPVITGICFPGIGFNCFEVSMDFQSPVNLAAGTYWIILSGQSNDWGVLLDEVFLGNELHVSTDGGTTWLPTSTQFGTSVGATFSITGNMVGGEYFTLDTTALLLAGVQTNLAWIIPVLSVAGIGIFFVKKKF